MLKALARELRRCDTHVDEHFLEKAAVSEFILSEVRGFGLKEPEMIIG
jgi:hypothetical protein